MKNSMLCIINSSMWAEDERKGGRDCWNFNRLRKSPGNRDRVSSKLGRINGMNL